VVHPLPGNYNDNQIEWVLQSKSWWYKRGSFEGIPQEIRGVKIENPDKEILRLESLIRDGITPRLVPVEIRSIKMLNENFIILIRIKPSWMSPHRVILQGHDKFYSRNSAGKYQMDVDELRNAFTLADTIRKNISTFRTDRILKIEANDTPVLCYESAKTILHLKYHRKSPDVSPWMEWVPKSSDRYDRIGTWRYESKPTVRTDVCITSSGFPDTGTTSWSMGSTST
jgi:hypothetical protein